MRLRTLAHDWCADASCETCSHRHKAESQPMRPNPAVGQVWRTHNGRLFVIQPGVLNSVLYSKCFEDGSHHGMYYELNECVDRLDTYIGQFAGFKVQVEGGK